jgi:Protease inhibitor Inh
MTKINAILLGSALALATIGLGQANAAVTGSWKLATGAADAPCTLTLTADNDRSTAGPAVSTGDCNGTDVSHWTTVGSSLQLMNGNGTLIAWLNPKGDAYVGQRVQDGRKVALTR